MLLNSVFHLHFPPRPISLTPIFFFFDPDFFIQMNVVEQINRSLGTISKIGFRIDWNGRNKAKCMIFTFTKITLVYATFSILVRVKIAATNSISPNLYTKYFCFYYNYFYVSKSHQRSSFFHPHPSRSIFPLLLANSMNWQ